MRAFGWIRLFAALAVLWNVIGTLMFLSEIGVIPGGGPPPGGAEVPLGIKICFGIGTLSGLAGSLGLALRRKWSRPVLWISLIALVIDWGWVFGFSGAASLPIGVTVLCVAALLVAFVELANRRAILE